VKLVGSPISPGLAMGAVSLLGDIFDYRPSVRPGADLNSESEWTRVQNAFAATRHDIAEAVGRLEREVSSEVADVFRAHQMMLDGLLSSGQITAQLRESGVDASGAVRRVFRAWAKKFQALSDPAFQQRADDVADLGRRVLRHLEGDDPYQLARLPEGAVVAAQRILPSDVVALAERRVAAILVESLGQASHAALLAREKSIPTLAIFGILEHVHDGDDVLVDAYGGSILVDAEAPARTEFEQRVLEYQTRLARCNITCHQPARTVDGMLIRVEANLGTRRDVELALGNGADGVGLFRIEQVYLGRELPPTEDELFEEMQATAAPLRDKPLTIRLLDVGGDKPLRFLRTPKEANPSLGLRGIRLLLRQPALLRTQLAAFVRLSRAQEVRVLVPMVTLEGDIRTARELFEEVCAAIRVESRPAFGAMIETPAAALAIPAIAPHVDFLSIGTNDLTQYTFAAGRDDPNVNDYFQDGHAALLRLLEIIVQDAGDLPVTLCGELAGREELLSRLLAIGLRSFSIAPPLIPGMKERIRSLRVGNAQA
jgi:phosphoenolpyruvate-protein phosphotransferase (PTS system enzyme I)